MFVPEEFCRRTHCPSIETLALLFFLWGSCLAATRVEKKEQSWEISEEDQVRKDSPFWQRQVGQTDVSQCGGGKIQIPVLSAVHFVEASAVLGYFFSLT